MKSKQIMLVAAIIGIILFLTIRLTCNKRNPGPATTKMPDIEIPPPRVVAGTYEYSDDSYMDLTMVVTPESDIEATFDISGKSRDNRTAQMFGTAPVIHSLTWYDEEEDCSLYIDFHTDGAAVFNECDSCCQYGVTIDGEYIRTRADAEADPIAGTYQWMGDEEAAEKQAALRVSHKAGNSYAFRIEGENTEKETTGTLAGAGDVFRSLIWRDEVEDCEVAIMFAGDNAAVHNTCEYCCQWNTYIDGDYVRVGK